MIHLHLAQEAGLVLTRLAVEHLFGALCPLILHHSCKVAVCDPAPHDGLDVNLVEAG